MRLWITTVLIGLLSANAQAMTLKNMDKEPRDVTLKYLNHEEKITLQPYERVYRLNPVVQIKPCTEPNFVKADPYEEFVIYGCQAIRNRLMGNGGTRH